MKDKTLTLASASPRRRELLALLGFPFEVSPADIDESPHPNESPEDYARRLSIEKAWEVARPIDGSVLVLAADTIVVDGADVLGKPRDDDDAFVILSRLRGRIHQVYTAITLFDMAAGRTITDLAGSPVQMRDYSDDEIADYIAGGDPFDKAGAYAIQHKGFHPVEHFDHCMANVMGLPLCHIVRSLRQIDIDLSNDVPAACQTHIGYQCLVFQQILARQK
ncbi:MAG: septum formation protein Maf [Anaerolineae bacterium]|nr:septum formation protein Maf [Anaerolineae bacterium]